ncbi:MAG: hypothetical protein WC806_06825, partial [Candidatus Gracilibacteria bacterium]
MTEIPSTQFENTDNTREQKVKEILALATELRESQEIFAFPGIEAEAYAKLKASDEEFPGYVTLIDELIERFKNEGMKVSLGAYSESEFVFILPAQSSDLRNDSIYPRHLQISETMDERL